MREILKKMDTLGMIRLLKHSELKKGFQESDFYGNTKVWYNKQVYNPNRKMKSLKDLQKDFFKLKI